MLQVTGEKQSRLWKPAHVLNCYLASAVGSVDSFFAFFAFALAFSSASFLPEPYSRFAFLPLRTAATAVLAVRSLEFFRASGRVQEDLFTGIKWMRA